MAHKPSGHQWPILDTALQVDDHLILDPAIARVAAIAVNPSDSEQPSSCSDDFDLSDHSLCSDLWAPATPVKRGLCVAQGATTDQEFVTPTSTRTGKKFKYLDMYASNWTVDSPKNQSARTGMVKLTYNATGATFDVLSTKSNKAQAALDPQTYDFLLVPSATQCRCARVCNKFDLTAGAVINLRRSIWESDEPTQVNIARLLRSYNLSLLNVAGHIPPSATLNYKIDGRQVCGRFWITVMGISDHTIRRSRIMAKNGRFVVGHAGTGMTKLHNGDSSPTAEASDALKIHAFWHDYFNIFCQRPNDDVRLFPTAETFKSLYISNFLPYAMRLGWTKIPSVELFGRVASTHPDFADVKRKKNHTHCRCVECSDCKALLAAGFRNGEELTSVQKRWELHQTSIRDWRNCEHYWTQLSQSTPHEVIVSHLPHALLLFGDCNEMN
jgi:hypothetical protein